MMLKHVFTCSLGQAWSRILMILLASFSLADYGIAIVELVEEQHPLVSLVFTCTLGQAWSRKLMILLASINLADYGVAIVELVEKQYPLASLVYTSILGQAWSHDTDIVDILWWSSACRVDWAIAPSCMTIEINRQFVQYFAALAHEVIYAPFDSVVS